MKDLGKEPGRAKANKTAIRYAFYWTLGVVAALAIDMFRRGVQPTNWIPMAIAAVVLLIVGIAYLSTTAPQERWDDAARKLSDPFYE